MSSAGHTWTISMDQVRSGSKHPMFGKKHSPESIQKMRSAKLGKIGNVDFKHTPDSIEKMKLAHGKGKDNPLFGRERPLEVRSQISESLMGEHHPNWKGGVSYAPYCPKFNTDLKRRVRDFFGNRCILCGALPNKKALHVHHVNHNKQTCCDKTDPMFVPLCPSCHGRISSSNQNRQNLWAEYFKKIIVDDFGGKSYLNKTDNSGIKL